jgi:hypothetical protein
MRAATRVYDESISIPGIHSNRRVHARGTTAGEPDRRFLVSMILGTYREMPGLTLHLNQAARLFGLRSRTCQVVLEDLVRSGRLCRTGDGQYTGI